MVTQRVKQLQKEGSENFEYIAGIIAGGGIVDIDIANTFPASRTYAPLDFMEVINNSAQIIQIAQNQTQEAFTIPAYMIKPFARKPVRTFRLTNTGAVATAAGEIIINLRKLPSDSRISIIGNLQG